MLHISYLLFTRKVMSNSFWLRGLHHTAAPQSCTISWSLFKFMSIESVMISNHLILCLPLFPFVLNLFQHQDLFQFYVCVCVCVCVCVYQLYLKEKLAELFTCICFPDPLLLLQQLSFRCVPFYSWVIFHCVYVPHLYPFICQWDI